MYCDCKYPEPWGHCIVSVVLFCCRCFPRMIYASLNRNLLDVCGWSPPPPSRQCRETALHNKAQFTNMELGIQKRACTAITERITERRKQGMRVVKQHTFVGKCVNQCHLILCPGVAWHWKNAMMKVKNYGQPNYSVSIVGQFPKQSLADFMHEKCTYQQKIKNLWSFFFQFLRKKPFACSNIYA